MARRVVCVVVAGNEQLVHFSVQKAVECTPLHRYRYQVSIPYSIVPGILCTAFVFSTLHFPATSLRHVDTAMSGTNDEADGSISPSLPNLRISTQHLVSPTSPEKQPDLGQSGGFAGFGAISKFAVKLKRKAQEIKKRRRGNKPSSPNSTSLTPSRFTHEPVSPVKYTERPQRNYRRIPLSLHDVPTQHQLDVARYQGRPQITAYPEFDGKIQLPPVTMSKNTQYQTPEERSSSVLFAEPDEDRLSIEGELYLQEMREGLFSKVFCFVDMMVPVFYCYDGADKQTYLHIREIQGQRSSNIVGWRDVASSEQAHFRLYCFELRSRVNLGTGTQVLTFGTRERELAYKWLNYIRRSSQQEHQEEDDNGVGGSRRAKTPGKARKLCPLPPPPTRRNRDLWPSFTDIALTEIKVEKEEEELAMEEKLALELALARNTEEKEREQQQVETNEIMTGQATKYHVHTIQNILLDVGLVMDEQWAGGPATVFTIEGRAALHIQKWYRATSVHHLVNGPHGLLRQQWAALVVQKALRGFRIRRRLRKTKESCVVIQRHWRRHRLARKIVFAKRDMDEKLKRAKAWFHDAQRMKVIMIWRDLTLTSLRAKDICRRVLSGNLCHKFEKWCSFVAFRREVHKEREKQEKKEKNRRAMFFIKKMIYRAAATALVSWKGYVEQCKRARAMLKRHYGNQLENHFVAWWDFVKKMKSARGLCSRVLLGVEKNRLDDWWHFIQIKKSARIIQSCWRGFTEYRNRLIRLRWQEYADGCAYRIQMAWRLHVAWQTTWGSGGVFIKMVSARSIQSLWRGYYQRQLHLLLLHRVRLLQGRFLYWMHRRRTAVIFIQYQWRRIKRWRALAAKSASTIQAMARGRAARDELAYYKEEVAWSYQRDGVVVRGSVRVSDRYGQQHRVLCTARHSSGSLFLSFVNPRTSTTAGLNLSTMQLVRLAEERWNLRRTLHDVVSLAEAVLDLVIVLRPMASDPEYILRPQVSGGRSGNTAAGSFPLRTPATRARHDVLPAQWTFWRSVYEAAAAKKESKLPIGPVAEAYGAGISGSGAVLRDALLAINEYCGLEENYCERIRIARSLVSSDLVSLLAGKVKTVRGRVEEDDDDDNDEDDDEDDEDDNEDDDGTVESKDDDVDNNSTEDDEDESKDDNEDANEDDKTTAATPTGVIPSVILSHSFALAQLVVSGLGQAPIDIFDRIEHSVADALLVLTPHDEDPATTPNSVVVAQRPSTRERESGTTTTLSSRWSHQTTATDWERLLDEISNELHMSLDQTQQMETPFVHLREKFEETLSIQSLLQEQACRKLHSGANDLMEYLAGAGPVRGAKDMVLRARISTFVEVCSDRAEKSAWSSHLDDLESCVSTFRIMEEMRIGLLDVAYESEANLSLEMAELDSERRSLISSFFSKRRFALPSSEEALLARSNHLMLVVLPELRQKVNSCSSAAEDLKSVLYDLGPGLEELRERCCMSREDDASWYASESVSILEDRDVMSAELEELRQEKIREDLEEAARGGKTMEQIHQERLEKESASRIQRVYRAYLDRTNNVNAGGVWSEIIHSSRILIHCMDMLVQVMEEGGDDEYELSMIQTLQMRVHKLSEQAVLRSLGPCMKHAFVVEKRWPAVDGLVKRWEEEERLAQLKADELAAGGGRRAVSSSDEESDWDSDEWETDTGEDDDDSSSDEDSSDEEGEGKVTRTSGKAAAARSMGIASDIHSKLRLLWRAHLAKIQEERDRQTAIRAARFGPRTKRAIFRGVRSMGRGVANSAPAQLVARGARSLGRSVREKLRTMKTYQRIKLKFALFGYRHFPQYFTIPEGVKERSAIIIQKRVRGMQARALAKQMLDDRDEKAFEEMLNGAAVTIQQLFRYFAARKYTLELVRTSYDKVFDDKAGKWCYHNKVADSYTYTKPPILGDRLDLPTPRSKARGMKWSAEYYVEKSQRSAVVQRRLVLTNTIMHRCNLPTCHLMEETPESFLECPRCKSKYYCTRAHQLNHLDAHGEECEEIVVRNREARARKRAAKKLGVAETDLIVSRDTRTDEQRAKDKMDEMFRLEKLIDSLKKGLITQEEYTFALRELKDL